MVNDHTDPESIVVFAYANQQFAVVSAHLQKLLQCVKNDGHLLRDKYCDKNISQEIHSVQHAINCLREAWQEQQRRRP